MALATGCQGPAGTGGMAFAAFLGTSSCPCGHRHCASTPCGRGSPWHRLGWGWVALATGCQGPAGTGGIAFAAFLGTSSCPCGHRQRVAGVTPALASTRWCRGITVAPFGLGWVALATGCQGPAGTAGIAFAAFLGTSSCPCGHRHWHRPDAAGGSPWHRLGWAGWPWQLVARVPRDRRDSVCSLSGQVLLPFRAPATSCRCHPGTGIDPMVQGDHRGTVWVGLGWPWQLVARVPQGQEG